MAGWLSLRGAPEQMETFGRGAEAARAAREALVAWAVGIPADALQAGLSVHRFPIYGNRSKGKFLDR